MILSKNMMFVLCLKLRLSPSQKEQDSITVFSCTKQVSGKYLIDGVHSTQNKLNVLEMDHTMFEILL